MASTGRLKPPVMPVVRQKKEKGIAVGISLNMIFHEAGLNLADVRLLRHKDKRATKGTHPL